jgi:hypothetical protein
MATNEVAINRQQFGAGGVTAFGGVQTTSGEEAAHWRIHQGGRIPRNTYQFTRLTHERRKGVH